MAVPAQWAISLDSWIIQDGNYPDFARGQEAEFAIEFWTAGPLEVAATGERDARAVSDSEYDVCGEVVAATESWWVLDFGLMVFQDARPPDEIEAGAYVRGHVGLGIDPFFYFERLHKFDGMPALVYTWTVDAIRAQTAPFIEAGRTRYRDPNRLGWRDVSRTNAWTDDEGHASYQLACTRLNVGPKRSSRTAK